MEKDKKEKVVINGKNLTAHEKKVYDFVKENGQVDFTLVSNNLGISPKSATSTLARLEKTLGLLKKNEPIKRTTYELKDND